jgi:hypothetical protein
LDNFQGEFVNASTMLKTVDSNLNDVELSSYSLVENAENTKEIMHTISLKSAELKTLADGFDIVLNNRGNDRTVLTPPISGKDNRGNELYIFDKSQNGISFYFMKKIEDLNVNDTIELQLNAPIDNRTTLRCQIKYAGLNIMEGVSFYGAQII